MVHALCLDGGGSTTLAVTAPDKLEANTANRPSDGAERKVSNQIFLVAPNPGPPSKTCAGKRRWR